MRNKLYSGAVLRACQLLGGPEEVARRLGVSRLLIVAILNDSLVPPPAVFLKLVDILMSAEAYEARARRISPGKYGAGEAREPVTLIE